MRQKCKIITGMVAILISLAINSNAQILVGDIGYPIKDMIIDDKFKIDSLLILEYADNYYISEKFDLGIKEFTRDEVKKVATSIHSQIGDYVYECEYEGFRYAKAYYSHKGKLRTKIISLKTTEFNDNVFKGFLYNRSWANAGDIIQQIKLACTIESNKKILSNSLLKFPNLESRQIKYTQDYNALTSAIQKDYDEKELESKRNSDKEKSKRNKLLDIISSGNEEIRSAMLTYNPIKGMSVRQIEYMNEIHESLFFKYDKFDRNVGSGFIYHISQESGGNYASSKIVVYYFKDDKLIDVYRDLTTVRKVHGKFEIN